MNRALEGRKRQDWMRPEHVQAAGSEWWSERPMDCDWHGDNPHERGSLDWVNQVDHHFVCGSRLFATQERPFDRIIPLDALKGQRVLEIGCGMGLHIETLIRAGADVTAVDLNPTVDYQCTAQARRGGFLFLTAAQLV